MDYKFKKEFYDFIFYPSRKGEISSDADRFHYYVYWRCYELTNLIGTGKIVGLIELSSDYLYDFYSFSNKAADFSITVEKPSFVLVPHGGWSGAGRRLIQKVFPKPVAKTVKAVRIFNKPVEAAKKFGQGYCLDASLMLVEGDSKSLSKALTYGPRKVFRYALWGAARRTKLGKIGGIGIFCDYSYIYCITNFYKSPNK